MMGQGFPNSDEPIQGLRTVTTETALLLEPLDKKVPCLPDSLVRVNVGLAKHMVRLWHVLDPAPEEITVGAIQGQLVLHLAGHVVRHTDVFLLDTCGCCVPKAGREVPDHR